MKLMSAPAFSTYPFTLTVPDGGSRLRVSEAIGSDSSPARVKRMPERAYAVRVKASRGSYEVSSQ